MPNPWDAGTAKLLASLGFQAVATTSVGHAATLGRLDGAVERGETLAHAASIVAAVDVPVSADLENGFADDPGAVFATVTEAVGVGLAGCSIEDFSGEAIYDAKLAAERVAAAVNAARTGAGLVLTARAENFIRGNPDLADTIARLQAYQDAGADVLYAPGLASLDDIRSVITSVDRPVNVLAFPGVATVPELAEIGVARISSAGPSASLPLRRWPEPVVSCSRAAPTGSWTSPPRAASKQPQRSARTDRAMGAARFAGRTWLLGSGVILLLSYGLSGYLLSASAFRVCGSATALLIRRAGGEPLPNPSRDTVVTPATWW